MNHHEAWFMINIKRWQQQKTNDFHCRNQIYHFECWFNAVFMSNKIWYHFLYCWNNRKVFKQHKNVLNNIKNVLVETIETNIWFSFSLFPSKTRCDCHFWATFIRSSVHSHTVHLWFIRNSTRWNSMGFPTAKRSIVN